LRRAGPINCETVQPALSSTIGIRWRCWGWWLPLYELILLLEDQVPFLAQYGRTLVLAAALFSVLFQLYLSVIEATVLEAWCQWCIASFVIVALIFAIAVYRLRRFLQPLRS